MQYELPTQPFCPKSDYAKICTPHNVESFGHCYKSRAINSQKTVLQENIMLEASWGIQKYNTIIVQ